MLTEQEIAALATDLESSRVERKESFKTSKDRIQEAICAFANDLPGHGAPGYVLIGVDDKAGKPTGLAVTDELLTSITSIRSDGNILPFPIMNVHKVSLDGKDIVVVEVNPSHDTRKRAS